MGQIAQKVLKDLRKGHALRAGVVDLEMARKVKQHADALGEAEDDLSEAPPGLRVWLSAFHRMAPVVSMVLQTPALRKVALRIEQLDSRYTPEEEGGAVHDSLLVPMWFADMGFGPRRETLCSVLLALATPLRLPNEVQAFLRALGDSHLDVFRLEAISDEEVELTRLSTDERLLVEYADADLAEPGLWLARILAPPPGLTMPVVWGTPYLLTGHEAERNWLDYMDRVAAGLTGQERKQALCKHFKGAGDSLRMLNYVEQACYGASEAEVRVLAGVPDRPETLPQCQAFDPATILSEEAPPIARLQQRLQVVVDAQQGFAEDGFDRLQDARVEHGLPELEEMGERADDPMAQMLRIAYLLYGHLDVHGRNGLDLLAESGQALSPDEQEEFDALREGWFSVFEVRHIQLDQGLELMDVLRRRKLQVVERAATRSLNRGDVLAGWIMVKPSEVNLEGGLIRLSGQPAERFTALMKYQIGIMAKAMPAGLTFRQRAGMMVPIALALYEKLYLEEPPTQLVNRHGEELVYAVSHYKVHDEQALRAALGKACEFDSEQAYVRLEEGSLEAEYVISNSGLRLEVRCHSRERLELSRAWLEQAVGGAVSHRVDEFDDPASVAARAVERPRPPETLPEEMRPVVEQMVLQHMAQWVDSSIPSLDGKTPRQAVRSKRGREQVEVLLARQTDSLQRNPQTAHVTLSGVYEALGLTPPSGERPT